MREPEATTVRLAVVIVLLVPSCLFAHAMFPAARLSIPAQVVSSVVWAHTYTYLCAEC